MTKFKLIVLLVLLTMVVSLSQMQSATSLPASPRPVWSPDGRHIVYRGAGGTYVMDRDGENSRQIAPNNVFFEHWTPDSQTLIFTGGFVDNQNQYWFYPLDGSEPQPAFQDFFTVWRYTYSPDGKYIALYGQKTEADLFGIWLIEVTDGFPAADSVLLADAALRDYLVFDIHWSKSSDELILWSTPQQVTDQLAHIYLPLSQPTDLKIVPRDITSTFYLANGWELGFDADQSSQPLVYVTDTVRHPDQAISFPLNHVISGYGVTLSPDEQTVLYVHYCNPEDVLTGIAQGSWRYGEVSNYTALSSLDLTTGIETTLFACDQNAQVVHTSFSPDSSSILFDTVDETGWHIYRADFEAGAVSDLVDITPAG